jgi:hypothetical protein
MNSTALITSFNQCSLEHLSEEANKKKKNTPEFRNGARYNVLTDNPNQMTEPRKKNITSDTENKEEQKQETS